MALVARCVLCACVALGLARACAAHGHHGGDHARDHARAWTSRDALDATLASLCVSGASLAAIGLIAMRVVGVRVRARWVSDVAIGAMAGDALGRQLPSALDAARGAMGESEGELALGIGCVVGVMAFHHLEGAIRARSGDGRGGDGTRASARRTGTSTRARGSRSTPARGAFAIERGSIAPSGWLNLFADAMHNVTDGVVIAVAFARRGRAAGWSTAWAALMHELPQEIGDYGILRVAGFSDIQALGFNLLSALVAVAATTTTFALLALAPAAAVDAPFLALVEAFCAGGFLRVALGSLIDADASSSTIERTIRVLVGAALALRA